MKFMPQKISPYCSMIKCMTSRRRTQQCPALCILNIYEEIIINAKYLDHIMLTPYLDLQPVTLLQPGFPRYNQILKPQCLKFMTGLGVIFLLVLSLNENGMARFRERDTLISRHRRKCSLWHTKWLLFIPFNKSKHILNYQVLHTRYAAAILFGRQPHT